MTTRTTDTARDAIAGPAGEAHGPRARVPAARAAGTRRGRRGRAWRLGSRVLAALRGVLAVSPLLTAAVLVALLYAVVHRGDVRLLSLDGKDDAQGLVRLARALGDVAAGSRAFLNADVTVLAMSASPVPAVTVPGTTLTLDALLRLFQWGPLRETEVRAALVAEEESGRRAHRMRILVQGPGLPARAMETEAMPTEDAAAVAGAEALYEALRPSGAAYYFHTRDADRALRLVDRILRDPASGHGDRVSALHVWGRVRWWHGDHADAVARIEDAVAEERARLLPDRQRTARLHVDVGYVQVDAGDLPAAARAFERAAADDPAWPVPRYCGAEVLRAMGRLDEAGRRYAEALALDPRYAEAWLGLARVRRERGDHAGAIAAWLSARGLACSADTPAWLPRRELGDLFAALGCAASAAREWDRAPDAAADLARPDWLAAGACLAPRCEPARPGGPCPTRLACEP